MALVGLLQKQEAFAKAAARFAISGKQPGFSAKKKTYPGLPQTIGFSRTIHGFLCAVWSQKAKAGCDNNADSLGVPHWCQPDTTGQHGAAVHGIFTEESKKKKVKLLLAISCIRGRKQRKYLKILHCLPLRSSQKGLTECKYKGFLLTP